jgi:hypothetical protein
VERRSTGASFAHFSPNPPPVQLPASAHRSSCRRRSEEPPRTVPIRGRHTTAALSPVQAHRGTEGSNPFPSSAEAGTNRRRRRQGQAHHAAPPTLSNTQALTGGFPLIKSAASDPSRIGSDQVRGVRFEGERMVLIPPPRWTGEIEEHREITRERIAGE